jgi:hypothetical protein
MQLSIWLEDCDEKVKKTWKTFEGVRDSQLCAAYPLDNNFIVPNSCEVSDEPFTIVE